MGRGSCRLSYVLGVYMGGVGAGELWFAGGFVPLYIHAFGARVPGFTFGIAHVC